MRLQFSNALLAKQWSDSAHAWLIANNPLYAESCALYVSSGGKMGTTRWQTQWRDVGATALSPYWITVDERVRGFLTPTQIATIPEWAAQTLP